MQKACSDNMGHKHRNYMNHSLISFEPVTQACAQNEHQSQSKIYRVEQQHDDKTSKSDCEFQNLFKSFLNIFSFDLAEAPAVSFSSPSLFLSKAVMMRSTSPGRVLTSDLARCTWFWKTCQCIIWGGSEESEKIELPLRSRASWNSVQIRSRRAYVSSSCVNSFLMLFCWNTMVYLQFLTPSLRQFEKYTWLFA